MHRKCKPKSLVFSMQLAIIFIKAKIYKRIPNIQPIFITYMIFYRGRKFKFNLQSGNTYSIFKPSAYTNLCVFTLILFQKYFLWYSQEINVKIQLELLGNKKANLFHCSNSQKDNRL